MTEFIIGHQSWKSDNVDRWFPAVELGADRHMQITRTGRAGLGAFELEEFK
jgi:predicted RNA-binding protein with TRAM domain